MKTIRKDILCRVGMDYHGGYLFIGELKGLDEEIANQVAKELNIEHKELHDKTCVIKKSGVQSISGDSYLAEKVLRLKLTITIEKCELVDDKKREHDHSKIIHGHSKYTDKYVDGCLVEQ